MEEKNRLRIVNTMRNKLLVQLLLVSVLPVLSGCMILLSVQKGSDLVFWTEVLVRGSLIMVIVAITSSYVISYRYTEGMERLAGDVRRMRGGDFRDIRIIGGSDEIAELSRAFHEMAGEMDILVNRTLRLTISERNAQIRALQSQISPHFLYNALDSINWNLLKKGDYEDSTLLVALSDILRYSINDSKENVDLEEEFIMVENYLRIQATRFSDRFAYEIRLDPEIRDAQVPRMILQPIVENAVVHGLENHKNGILKVCAGAFPWGIAITVRDNGSGISPERLRQLRQQIQQGGQIADTHDFHLGMANVHNRLRYRYGEGSGLTIESVEQVYTCVTIRIQKGNGTYEDFDCGG